VPLLKELNCYYKLKQIIQQLSKDLTKESLIVFQDAFLKKDHFLFGEEIWPM